MSKMDKIKAGIAFNEKLFFVNMTSLFALVAWTVTNYKNVDLWLLIITVTIIIIASIFTFSGYRRVKRLIEELAEC
ncbi:MAG: membrane protein insertase Oxa1/YidC/SpoIIIJ [Oleiphilaceae bacterium]|jgi:membrane protein insertase Oxa1/YidC/SpoIIIJ